jgi:pyruvate formate lyase activating enzyme
MRRWSARHRLLLVLAAAALAAVLGIARPAAVERPTPAQGYIEARPASYWEPLPNGFVQCRLCPRTCVVAPGERGNCGVRENRGGTYYTLTYGNPCAIHVDPIEKKPFFHFLPGTTAYSIATAGCNLHCKFCQNWQISQSRPEELENYRLAPKDVIEAAIQSGSPSVAYTYSEPTIFFEYMLDCAKLAHERGLKNVYHSNGYINEAPLREICQYLDAANVDLKGFTDDYYRDMSGGSLAPVLQSLKILKEEGVHLEITTLVVPGRNDDPETLAAMCQWIHDNLGPEVPLHFSRFHPEHKLMNLAPTPVETLNRARKIALDAGLKYVYIGNVPGSEAENTSCPNCGRVIVKRVGYSVDLSGLVDGACKYCGAKIDGVWK